MKNSILFFQRGVNTIMEEDYNLDEVKGFVKSYCDPEVDVDQQLKDSAWILLQELNKCTNHNEESKEKEGEIEKPQQQYIAKEEEKPVVHKKEVVSEKKIKRLMEKRQGKSSYIEFVKNQARTIGAAGLIAMAAGAVTQAEIIKKESIVIIEHLRHEVPAINRFLNKINDLFLDKDSKTSENTPSGNSTPIDSNDSVPKVINPPSVSDVNPPSN